MSKKLMSWKWLAGALWFAIILLIILLSGIEIWRLFCFKIILLSPWTLMLYYITMLIIIMWLWFWIRDTRWTKIRKYTPDFIISIVVLYYLFRILFLWSDLIWKSYFYEWKCWLIESGSRYWNKYYLSIEKDNLHLNFRISNSDYEKLWGYYNTELRRYYKHSYECSSEVKINYLRNSKFILDIEVKNSIRKYDSKKMELEPSWNIIVNWEVIDVSKLINQ